MTRAETIQRIRAHSGELSRFGVKTLSLFGSVARDAARVGSDVDVLVEFEGSATFDAYMDVKELLEQILERRVDLVTRAALKPLIRPYVEQDLVRVA
jgi:predicted nucleotidyltransferase